MIGLLCSALLLNSATLFPGFAAALPVVATALVIVGGSGAHRWSPFRALSVRPLVFIGLISYSLYLVHWPLLVIPQEAAGRTNPLPLWLTLLLGLLAVPLAYLLYKFVEDPMRSARFLAGGRPRKTLLAALVASVGIVALTGSASFVSERLPLNSGIYADPTPGQLDPVATTFVPSNAQPTLQKVSDDNPAIYDNNCHRRFSSTDSSGCQYGVNAVAPQIALFGDSHAAQWFPALDLLAEDGTIRLDTNTKSSCPAVDVKVMQSDSEYSACDTWRDGVVARLTASPPDLIVISSDGAADLFGGTANYQDRWRRGIADMVARLPTGVPVVILSDSPNQGATPSVCLSANLSDTVRCDTPRSRAINSSIAEAESAAATESGATSIDMNDYICNGQTCPNVIGNVLVYRDAHHLTATFSKTLSKVLYQRLAPLLSTH